MYMARGPLQSTGCSVAVGVKVGIGVSVRVGVKVEVSEGVGVAVAGWITFKALQPIKPGRSKEKTSRKTMRLKK